MASGSTRRALRAKRVRNTKGLGAKAKIPITGNNKVISGLTTKNDKK